MRMTVALVLLSTSVLAAEAPGAEAPAEVPAEAPKAEAPAASAAPAPAAAEAVEVPKRSSLLRRLSYAVLGASVITAGTGVYLGVISAGARAQVRADRLAGTFIPEALDQRDAAAITQGRIANGLLISAAVVAVIGIVMFVLGG